MYILVYIIIRDTYQDTYLTDITQVVERCVVDKRAKKLKGGGEQRSPTCTPPSF